MARLIGRIKLTTIAAVVVAALAIPLSALAHQTTAKQNLVTAATSYASTSPNAKLRLTITHDGQQLYNQLVTSRLCRGTCGPVPIGKSHSALRVLDLESDGQPDVVLGLNSGGAHCCFVDQVYSLDPGTMTYVKSEHDFQDAGAAIKNLGGGHYRFVSASEAFAYVFSDFADSGAPIQIWSFSGRRFHDVTRQYPKLITADAALWLRSFKHNLSNGDGLIAAWAADEDMLGNSKLVSATLAAELHQGDLRSSLGTNNSEGQGFVTALQKLLRKLGYTH
jgi:hypothetical protein